MTHEKIIAKLAETNSFEYNLTKACEELSELSEVLLKRLTKAGGPKEPAPASIIEEIGDVAIRISILSEIFGTELVQKRVDIKMERYDDYLKKGIYKGKI